MDTADRPVEQLSPSQKRQRLIVLVSLALLFLCAVGAGVAILKWSPRPTGRLVDVGGARSSVAAVAPVAINAPAGWRERFDKVYSLGPNELVKRIAPPFIEERTYFYQTEYGQTRSQNSQGCLILRWSNGRLTRYGSSSNDSWPIALCAQVMGGVPSYELELPPELQSIQLPGDWLFQAEAKPVDRLQALASVVGQAVNKKLSFVQEPRERDVLLVSGTYAFKPIEGAPDQTSIQLYVDRFDPPNQNMGGGQIDLGSLFRSYVGSQLGMPAEIDKNLESVPVSFRMHSSMYSRPSDPQQRQAWIEKLYKILRDQSGLIITTEKRQIPVWVGKVE